MSKQKNQPKSFVIDGVTVESGVPVPERDAPRSKWAALYGAMSVGDSCFIPCADAAAIKRLKFGATSGARRHGIKVVTRVLTEGDRQGVRIWRVAADTPADTEG